jgi:hypothetical protein
MELVMEFVKIVFFAVATVTIYMLPTFIAAKRNCKARNAIGIVDLFLGWTFVGWVVALAWSASGEVEPVSKPIQAS